MNCFPCLCFTGLEITGLNILMLYTFTRMDTCMRHQSGVRCKDSVKQREVCFTT